MSFKIAWVSCEQRNRLLRSAYFIEDLQCKVGFALGDCPYTTTSYASVWGVSSTAVTDGTGTEAQFDGHHDQMHLNPGWVRFRNAVNELYYGISDHDVGPGDNWDHTVATSTLADMDEVIDIWDKSQAAITTAISNYYANPVNSDSGADPELPPTVTAHAPATPVAQYPVRYFRVGYNLAGNIDNSSPHVEFFVIDCISYRDELGVASTMLGANQLAWLKAKVAASTATFKVIVSDKKTYANSGADNTDIWSVYSTERDDLLDQFDTDGVTGILWIVGDRHTPSIEALAVADSQARDHVCICACPVGNVINTNAGDAVVDAQSQWINRSHQVFGVLEILSNMIKIEIRRDETGAVLWSGRVLEGTNYLSAATPTKVA